MERLNVAGEVDRSSENGGTVGTTERDGDNKCVTGRRPIPMSLSGIHSILSNAAQPLPPNKLFSVPISWELKLVVTKSYSIRAGTIFRS